MPARAFPFSLTLPARTSELASSLAPLFEGEKAPLYPYTYFVRTVTEPKPHAYRMLALENEHIRALIAPELGGRVYSLRDKRLRTPEGREGPGAELLYDNHSIKPYRIEPRNSWISAGIELNFPVAHSHTSLEPVASRFYEADGRAYVEVGETERRLGLTWVVRFSLGEGETYLTQETFLHNPTPRPCRWQFWTNAGVDGFDDTEFVYPPANVHVHGSKTERGVWPMDWKMLGDREGMLGLFWLDHTDIYFGAFHHRLGVGLLHLADPAVVPGMKMWTFGKAGTLEWAKLLSDDERGYAEVQSGAFKTQEDFGTFAPGESAYFIEFWTGAASLEDFRQAVLPKPTLGAPPPRWFGMEHIPEAQRWLTLAEAHRTNTVSAIPAYDPQTTDWPPTGLELEAALRWAASRKQEYRTALGTWLAARGQYKQATEALDGIADPYGRRVSGLMAWRYEKNLPKARRLFDSLNLTDTGHLLDHDALLAHCGDHAARKAVQDRLPPAESRSLERKADLLVATGRAQDAIDLIMAQKWWRRHERFILTDIWRRARAALGQPQDPVPEHLGEDKVPPISEAPTPHGPLDGVLRRLPELPSF